MSIASEITRLTNAKSAIKAAIAAKGVNISNSVTLDNYSTYISSISVQEDEVGYDPLNDVMYIDYDGKVVTSYSKTEFLALTEHPANPDRTGEGLTAQGWNWSFADAKEYVTANGALVIGQQYVTTDGKTRFLIDTRLSPGIFTQTFAIILKQSKAQGVLIEWGDGTSERFASTITNTSITHSYAQEGEYTIVLTPDDDCTLIPGYSGAYGSLFGYANSAPLIDARCKAIKEIHYGKNVTEVGLSYNINLQKVSIPNTVTSVRALQYLYKLKGLVLPENTGTYLSTAFNNMNTAEFVSFNKDYIVTNINISSVSFRMITLPAVTGTVTASLVYSLERFVYPSNITGLTLSGNGYMDRIVLPEGITTVPNSGFNPNVFISIDLPSTITTIGTNAFNARYDVQRLESITVRATTPPTIQANSFAYTNDCTIYVPGESLSNYQSASNWNAVASRIQAIPTT